MIREDWFYCLSCSLEQPIEKSGMVFRTGYYRCLMRLGLCETCISPESAARFALLDRKQDGQEASSTHMAPELP